MDFRNFIFLGYPDFKKLLSVINMLHQRNIKIFFLLVTFMLSVLAVFSEPEIEKRIYEKNFGKDETSGKYITARELKIWAGNHNLVTVDDSPIRSIQDFEAEVIPPSGLKFNMSAPGSGRVFLHLDLVQFKPVQSSQLMKVYWLEIIVNGHILHTIYQGGRSYFKSPVIVVVDREHTIDRQLRINLRPAPGEGFFAIWDAYASIYRADDY